MSILGIIVSPIFILETQKDPLSEILGLTLIAEHSTPAFVAVALVRLAAGAVIASGIPFAFCAELSLPPIAAPGEKKRLGYANKLGIDIFSSNRM